MQQYRAHQVKGRLESKTTYRVGSLRDCFFVQQGNRHIEYFLTEAEAKKLADFLNAMREEKLKQLGEKNELSI